MTRTALRNGDEFTLLIKSQERVRSSIAISLTSAATNALMDDGNGDSAIFASPIPMMVNGETRPADIETIVLNWNTVETVIISVSPNDDDIERVRLYVALEEHVDGWEIQPVVIKEEPNQSDAVRIGELPVQEVLALFTE